MKQSILASAGFGLVTKPTPKRVFLDEMSLVVQWVELVSLIQPFASTGTKVKDGRPAKRHEVDMNLGRYASKYCETGIRASLNALPAVSSGEYLGCADVP